MRILFLLAITALAFSGCVEEKKFSNDLGKQFNATPAPASEAEVVQQNFSCASFDCFIAAVSANCSHATASLKFQDLSKGLNSSAIFSFNSQKLGSSCIIGANVDSIDFKLSKDFSSSFGLNLSVEQAAILETAFSNVALQLNATSFNCSFPSFSEAFAFLKNNFQDLKSLPFQALQESCKGDFFQQSFENVNFKLSSSAVACLSFQGCRNLCKDFANGTQINGVCDNLNSCFNGACLSCGQANQQSCNQICSQSFSLKEGLCRGICFRQLQGDQIPGCDKSNACANGMCVHCGSLNEIACHGVSCDSNQSISLLPVNGVCRSGCFNRISGAQVSDCFGSKSCDGNGTCVSCGGVDMPACGTSCDNGGVFKKGFCRQNICYGESAGTQSGSCGFLKSCDGNGNCVDCGDIGQPACGSSCQKGMFANGTCKSACIGKAVGLQINGCDGFNSCDGSGNCGACGGNGMPACGAQCISQSQKLVSKSGFCRTACYGESAGTQLYDCNGANACDGSGGCASCGNLNQPACGSSCFSGLNASTGKCLQS